MKRNIASVAINAERERKIIISRRHVETSDSVDSVREKTVKIIWHGQRDIMYAKKMQAHM